MIKLVKQRIWQNYIKYDFRQFVTAIPEKMLRRYSKIAISCWERNQSSNAYL